MPTITHDLPLLERQILENNDPSLVEGSYFFISSQKTSFPKVVNVLVALGKMFEKDECSYHLVANVKVTFLPRSESYTAVLSVTTNKSQLLEMIAKAVEVSGKQIGCVTSVLQTHLLTQAKRISFCRDFHPLIEEIATR